MFSRHKSNWNSNEKSLSAQACNSGLDVNVPWTEPRRIVRSQDGEANRWFFCVELSNETPTDIVVEISKKHRYEDARPNKQFFVDLLTCRRTYVILLSRSFYRYVSIDRITSRRLIYRWLFLIRLTVFPTELFYNYSVLSNIKLTTCDLIHCWLFCVLTLCRFNNVSRLQLFLFSPRHGVVTSPWQPDQLITFNFINQSISNIIYRTDVLECSSPCRASKRRRTTAQ